MKIDILKMPEGAADWWKVSKFMKLRSDVFVQRLGWDLTEAEGMEYEIYDHFAIAHYVVASEGETILGGARLIRCDSRVGPRDRAYSYMIRDAHRGLIDLPRDIVFEEPTSSETAWELTRLVVAREGQGVAREILIAANDFIKGQGATECLFLAPPVFMLMARRMGFNPKPLGPVRGNLSGEFLAFQCAVI